MPEKTAVEPEAPVAKMTYEEFLEWLDEDTHAEWVNGEVVRMSPVSLLHVLLAEFLRQLIGIFVRVRGLGVLLSEPFQMKTTPNLPGRSPDIFFVANENLSRLKEIYLDGPADFVIEIISPESRGRDRGEKFYEYEQGGVREYWLLDPYHKRAEFYQLGEDGLYPLIPVEKDGVYHSKVLDGLWLRVEWLWQAPLPSVLDILKEWGLI